MLVHDGGGVSQRTPRVLRRMLVCLSLSESHFQFSPYRSLPLFSHSKVQYTSCTYTGYLYVPDYCVISKSHKERAVKQLHHVRQYSTHQESHTADKRHRHSALQSVSSVQTCARGREYTAVAQEYNTPWQVTRTESVRTRRLYMHSSLRYPSFLLHQSKLCYPSRPSSVQACVAMVCELSPGGFS